MNAYRQTYEQFFEDASFLWSLRAIAANQPNYTTQDLHQLEQRIQANLDGLMTSLDEAWEICLQGLEMEQAGELFTTAVIAFRSHDMQKIQYAVESSMKNEDTLKGMLSALGWLPDSLVHEWVKKLLHSKQLDHKYLAIAACSVRRENPGAWLNRILDREDCRQHPKLYNRSLRLVGELRRNDLLPQLEAALDVPDQESRFWALWSLQLLGSRSQVNQLLPYVLSAGPMQLRAMDTTLRILPLDQARSLISQLAKLPGMPRQVIIGSGILGDPHAINWLIGRMQETTVARLAGEAFSNITGIDLDQHGLSKNEPPEMPEQPNDDTEDDDVSMDEDENLPWPDAEKVAHFWNSYGQRFVSGKRFFCGQPISADVLKQMLSYINQRQRHQAALELALIDPNMPYLNTQART